MANFFLAAIHFLIVQFSGSRKSLPNVFQDGMCHPKMAMVIDDRSKVWEDKDQPRVHVVPAFTPYYAPQAEVQFYNNYCKKYFLLNVHGRDFNFSICFIRRPMQSQSFV